MILATSTITLAAVETVFAPATVNSPAIPVDVFAPLAQEFPSYTPGHFQFYDSLGKVVRISTNEVPSSLHPPATVGVEHQFPTPAKGASQSEYIRDRILESKSDQDALEWFPATPPALAPYLGNLDDFGNTAVQPGAFVATDPFSNWAQSSKYWLSNRGLRENLYQSLTLVGMSDTVSGENSLQYYAATFLGKWAVFEEPHGGPAGWLSIEADVQLGLSQASRTESPQGNLGALVNPQANVSGPNGIWMSELAWQQSLLEGQLVLLAGLVDQANYLDANKYANNSQSQFLSGAFVNGSVLPLPSNNLGASVQWQPNRDWYVLFGTGANNQIPGQSPFQELGLDDWSYLGELGLTPKDVLDLGSGVYRVQPFLATVGGHTQAGLGVNIQQQLGENSPWGSFARLGVVGTQVALAGVRAQASAGVVMAAPLQYAGLGPRLSNDLLGLGFVWSQASPATQMIYHENEYALETFYSLQLTPTVKLQPDLQFVWNPSFNPEPGPALVWQLQLNIQW